jgi:hypothetical protein
MTGIDRCLAQIDAVRSVALGVEPAYVARSRIGRLTLSTAALVAQEVGDPIPVVPADIQFSDTTPVRLRAVAACCDRICELARHLAQPSEPLEIRWKRGWHELLAHLKDLEVLLVDLRREEA